MKKLNPIYKNEDDRRLLIEWVDDMIFRSCKIVIAKSEQAVGDHFHNKKDEVFLLLKGKAKKVIIGDKEEFNIEAPIRWEVPMGIYHLFELEKDSILLGIGTKKFDINDEIKR